MLNPHTTGLALGKTFGLIHAIWSVLVAIGVAPMLVEALMRLHFVREQVIVLPFDIMTAVLLIIFTSIVGYLVGAIFAICWNHCEE